MIEILQFVFTSFWTWLGSAVLLGIATFGFAQSLFGLATIIMSARK